MSAARRTSCKGVGESLACLAKRANAALTNEGTSAPPRAFVKSETLVLKRWSRAQPILRLGDTLPAQRFHSHYRQRNGAYLVSLRRLHAETVARFLLGWNEPINTCQPHREERQPIFVACQSLRRRDSTQVTGVEVEARSSVKRLHHFHALLQASGDSSFHHEQHGKANVRPAKSCGACVSAPAIRRPPLLCQ